MTTRTISLSEDIPLRLKQRAASRGISHRKAALDILARLEKRDCQTPPSRDRRLQDGILQPGGPRPTTMSTMSTP
jgi:hypothetical protein